MNTSIYGNRDFKGNIVYNPRIHPVADLTELSTLVPGGTGQQAWVEAEKRPYWWDGTEWKSYPDPVDPGEDFYGVRTHGITPIAPDTDPSSIGTSNILSRAKINAYPEITDDRKLVVELYGVSSFFLKNNATPSLSLRRTGQFTIFIEIGTGLSIGSHYGTFNHGWHQYGVDNTIDGKLSIIEPSPTVPVFYQVSDIDPGIWSPESVDVHQTAYGASGSGSYILAFRSASVNHPIFKWDFSIDMTEPGVGEDENNRGLLMNIESLNLGDWVGLVYDTDPSIEFDGLPRGHARTIYF